ncbi:TPA: hypothetical protein G8549_004519 [Salmonella enterica]|uniref:Uncharacterized protein n=1 Tax=Salmonella enterica TaxID=28901 RepID=A0A763YNJ3_SALER|nr:hypothetical protein [Salmonella enterica]
MKFTISLLVSGYDEPISTFSTDDSELDPYIYKLAKQYINCMQDGFYLSNERDVVTLIEAINPKQEITTNNFIDDNATDDDVYLDVRRSFYNDFIDNDVWAVTLELPEDYVSNLQIQYDKEEQAMDLMYKENQSILLKK